MSQCFKETHLIEVHSKKMKHLILGMIFSLAVTYRVYDANWKLIEIWEDKGEVIDIYDSHYARKGYIEKKGTRWERYNQDWQKESTIERSDGGPITIDRVEE